MRAAIVAVGDELLRGIVLDTNSHWLAQRLSARGVEVATMLTLPDRPEVVAEALRPLLDLDLVVVSGGLGPTDDDRTLEALALATGRPLAERPEVVARLLSFYDRLAGAGVIDIGGLDPARRRMARLPDGAEPLPNPVGAAPGVWLPPFAVLPGVPSEMKAIWLEAVEPRFPGESVVELTGVIDSDDESALAPAARGVAARFPRAYLKTRAQDFGGTGVVVTAFGPVADAEAALAALAEATGLSWRSPPRPPSAR